MQLNQLDDHIDLSQEPPFNPMPKETPQNQSEPFKEKEEKKPEFLPTFLNPC